MNGAAVPGLVHGLVPSAATAPFWAGARAGRLLVQRCRVCAVYQYYPRPFCAACLTEGPEFVEVSGRGRVHSFTVVARAPLPELRDRTPYVIALVELDEDVRMMANIVGTDPDTVRIGQPVRVDFVPLTPDITLPVFVPDLARATVDTR